MMNHAKIEQIVARRQARATPGLPRIGRADQREKRREAHTDAPEPASSVSGWR